MKTVRAMNRTSRVRLHRKCPCRRYRVDPAWCAKTFDTLFYRGLIDKAWREISYAFPMGEPPK